ncbi:hypothetical protein [Propionispira raffinosivorans]|uniref:hypothetical protein n=1 Tax=Propionispira raffinosivorans TaxID=86959 RepID=UPI00037E165E|nr:hypothetical protein [Propionispira raffinosivorans]
MALPVKEQESLIEREVENINFINFSILSKTHYDKKIFSRSRNDIYGYSSDFSLTEVEEMCLNELKKNQWTLLRTRKINDEKKTYILQKNDLYALLRFEEKNIFSLQIGYITLENKINNFP